MRTSLKCHDDELAELYPHAELLAKFYCYAVISGKAYALDEASSSQDFDSHEDNETGHDPDHDSKHDSEPKNTPFTFGKEPDEDADDEHDSDDDKEEDKEDAQHEHQDHKNVKCPSCQHLIREGENTWRHHTCGALWHRRCFNEWTENDDDVYCPRCGLKPYEGADYLMPPAVLVTRMSESIATTTTAKDSDCKVCGHAMKESDDLFRDAVCGHTWHRLCLKDWVEEGMNPYCTWYNTLLTVDDCTRLRGGHLARSSGR